MLFHKRFKRVTIPFSLPAHSLQNRLGEVIRWHDNVLCLIGATPWKNWAGHLRGPSLLQGPVPQIHKKLNVWKLDLVTHNSISDI